MTNPTVKPRKDWDGSCPDCGEFYKWMESGDCECSLKDIVILNAKDFEHIWKVIK